MPSIWWCSAHPASPRPCNNAAPDSAIWLTPHKLRRDFQGPHLIGRDELLDLGAILGKLWPKLELARQSDVDDWVREEVAKTHAAGWTNFTEAMARDRIPYDLRNSKMTVVLELDSGAECRAESLEHAINELFESEHSPKSLAATIESGDHSIKVNLSPGLAGRRAVSVEPPSSDLAKEAFVELCAWFDRSRPSAVARVYKLIAPIGWMLVVAIAVIAFWQASAGSSTPIDLKPAEALLVDGITTNEVPKALELILRKSYGLATPAPVRNEQDPTDLFRAYLIAGAILLVVLTSLVVPDLSIGLGKKARGRIRLAKGWLKYVALGVPGVACTLLLWPLLSNWALALLQ